MLEPFGEIVSLTGDPSKQLGLLFSAYQPDISERWLAGLTIGSLCGWDPVLTRMATFPVFHSEADRQEPRPPSCGLQPGSLRLGNVFPLTLSGPEAVCPLFVSVDQKQTFRFRMLRTDFGSGADWQLCAGAAPMTGQSAVGPEVAGRTLGFV